MTIIYSGQNVVPQKARVALLPLLVLLFLVSYAILTLLVVEQGKTIEAQRGLLRELAKDSSQLAALKTRIARNEDIRTTEPPGTQHKRSADSTTSQAVTPKAPVSPTPESRKPGKATRNLKQAPGKPAADLEDVRRSTHEI